MTAGGMAVRYDVGQIAIAVFLDGTDEEPDHVFTMSVAQARAFDKLLITAIRKAELLTLPGRS